jgi:membrane protease YdiL (CAAX protease family)
MFYYIKVSKSFQYSIILTAPLAVFYELSTLLLFSTQSYELRNTADIFIRDWINQIGLDAPFLISILFALLFIIMIGLGIQREEKYPIISKYFMFMILESIGLGIILYLLLMAINGALTMQMLNSDVATVQLNLAIGAGIYEELIFRVILIPIIMMTFMRGFQFKKGMSVFLAIVGSSTIFSFFHLLIEPFTLQAFMSRFLGGMFLSTVYVWRGYGITVYTHISSNLLTLFGL